MVQPVINAAWETDVGESQVQVQPELHRVPEAILGNFVRPCLKMKVRDGQNHISGPVCWRS